MLNKSTSSSKYVVQSGVTQYPVGFEFFFNGDDTPQIRVTIGAMVAEENLHFVISEDLLTIKLIPLEEEAPVDPNDYSWMDKWVGMELVIERDIPFVQESDYQLGRISPERIEKDFDLSVMRDQILAGQIQEHTDDVQVEIDALNSRIDFVQEEHVLDMAEMDKALATKAVKADVDAEFTTVKADLATKATKTELANTKTVLEEGIQGNADAILKTRNDYEEADQKIRADMNSKDSELETIINDHATRLSTLRTDVDDLGDDVSDIQSKIPESASGSNPLITKQQLLDEEMDIRDDLNSGLSELQTQITSHAAEIAGKQDKLTAGENIIIVDNVISATGGGELPDLENIVATSIQAQTAKFGENPSVDYENILPWENSGLERLVTKSQVQEALDSFEGGGGGGSIQVETLPDLSEELDGKIYQYVGVTDGTYTNGMFYKCNYDGGWGTWKELGVYMPRNPDFTQSYFCGSVAAQSDITKTINNSVVFGVGIYYLNSLGNSVILGRGAGSVADLTTATINGAVAIGYSARVAHSNAVAIGYNSRAAQNATAIGYNAKSEVRNGVQIGNGTLSDANVLLQVKTYPLVSSTGTIIADRMSATAGTTGQVLTKTDEGMAWADASGGGGGASLPDQTGNAGKFLTTDGTEVSWGDALPLSGGTLTGQLSLRNMVKTLKFDGTSFGIDAYGNILRVWFGGTSVFYFDQNSFYGASTNVFDEKTTLGNSDRRWSNVYAESLNNGADLIIPTEGGTLARLEDITATVGDISSVLDAINGEAI